VKVEMIHPYLKIKESDTGIGICEEDILKLFKPFEKLDKNKSNLNGSGVGLGLFISNELAIRLCNPKAGGIKIESLINKGSCFTFLLENKFAGASSIEDAGSLSNVQDECEARRIKSSYIHSSPFDAGRIPLPPIANALEIDVCLEPFTPMNKKKNSRCKCSKILEVDDDCFNILAMEVILKQLNFKCDAAYSGEEAIKMVLNRANNPCSKHCFNYQMILMDCSMPIMDGFEATRRLRAYMTQGTIPEIPIIGCTAYTSSDKYNECLTNGMIECISKPISKVKLSFLVTKYVSSS
jgi:CheY-like chemotaxis protein